MAWFLMLYGSTHRTNQSSRFRLAPEADPMEVRLAVTARDRDELL